MAITVFFCISAVKEDLPHLFFHCPFASTCRSSLQLQVPNAVEVEAIIEAFRVQLQLPFFMEIVATMCWAILMVRNNAIF